MSAERSPRRARLIFALVAVALIVAAFLAVFLGLRRRGAPAPTSTALTQIYTCPMHPQIREPRPGKCPICGMDLVPVEEPQRPAGESGAGPAALEIDPRQQQLIGVATTRVIRRPLRRVIRATGQVVPDESLLTDVHARVDGWIETLYANRTGMLVRRGEPLLSIYSPDLLSTQQEYLVALRARERVAASPFPEVRRSADSLVAAARKRLQLWKVSDADIQRLERTGQARPYVTIYAPATGYIMEKEAVAGMRVMPDTRLFRLADLSRVWVEADIYEAEASLARVGQLASVSLQSSPGRSRRGRVTYVYPTVEPETRTLKVRLEFPNPGLELKPGMYATVEIEVSTGEQLAVPEQAVLDTGVRKIVYVKEAEGRFVPREVVLGPRAEGYYPVLSGLKEGEQVVSSPAFLLDSESRLRAPAPASTTAGGHAGHSQ